MIRLIRIALGLVLLGIVAGLVAGILSYLAYEGGITTEERIRTGATVIGAIGAMLGLAGVWVTLDRNARQQRIQTGPFVRVDVGMEGVKDFSAESPLSQD